MSFRHSNVIPSFKCHSDIIPCLAKLKSCGLSFRGHSLQEWLWNDIFISFRSFPDGMIWNDNCPHPTGMTGMALEWLDWAQNDGMRRPPKRSFEFPSLSFLPHPVIPASSGNVVTMGMSLEWRRTDSGRGTKVRYFPWDTGVIISLQEFFKCMLH